MVQHHEWLKRLTHNLQSLLHFVQTWGDGWFLPSFLFCLFWTAVALLFSSATFTPCLTAWRQAGWSFACFSQVSMSLPHSLRSLLQVSCIGGERGQLFFCPLSVHHARCLRMRPGSMHLTWPSQCRHLALNMANMLFMLALSHTSVSGTLSSQWMWRMRRRHLMWKLFSFFSCFA